MARLQWPQSSKTAVMFAMTHSGRLGVEFSVSGVLKLHCSGSFRLGAFEAEGCSVCNIFSVAFNCAQGEDVPVRGPAAFRKAVSRLSLGPGVESSGNHSAMSWEFYFSL